MLEPENQDEIDAYYMSDPLHPRAAAIMWPVILEKRIDKLFSIALRPDDKVKNDLLSPSGALGNYGAKVQLAYLLGWIGAEIYRDLITISKIRNRFAHNIEVKDFSDQKIEAWLSNLTGSKILPDALEKVRNEAEAYLATSPQRNVPMEPGEMKTSPVGILMIFENIANDPVLKFRWCIDLMLGRLNKYAVNMERNLKSLPGSWMVGSEKPEKYREAASSSEIPEG